MTKPLLSVKNLKVEFPAADGRLTAVNNITFDIFPGEIVALVGESGSGKSVTGLSIIRLVEQGGGSITEGNITFLSDNIDFDLVSFTYDQMSTIRGRQISMIFQEPMTSLNPALSCGYQIAEVIRRHLKKSAAQAKTLTLEVLGQVGIPAAEEAYHKYPHQFSGGQKQRIMLAMAIACGSQLVIADEPTTALDASVQRKIIRLLKDIQQQRSLSMLYITHDLDSIEHFADRVMVMYAGKIVEQGPVREIFGNPQHPYTKGLLACRPPKKGRYYFLPTTDDFMRISADGSGVQESADLGEIFRELEVAPSVRRQQVEKIYQGEPVIKVEGLSKSYYRRGNWWQRNRFQAVDQVSFSLYPGETLGLVGESGCGKSTLARCIIGLLEPDTGGVLMKGRDMNGYAKVPPLQRIGSKIQYVFQDPYSSLNPRRTIGQILLEPLHAHGLLNSRSERMDKVHELLAKVGLKPFHFDRYPHEFSGGQRQRICIARALLLEPEVIICDEAVSALDVSVQAHVLNLLNELKYEYGLSYIFISHDLSVVRYMSDRVMVMKDGRIVEEGEADRVFWQPQHEYTRELVGE